MQLARAKVCYALRTQRAHKRERDRASQAAGGKGEEFVRVEALYLAPAALGDNNRFGWNLQPLPPERARDQINRIGAHLTFERYSM